jgi:periplasmic divalent cation tolerance protein
VLLVFTTVSDQSAGESLASKIVEAKLAACVQVLPRMTSIYVWEGRVTKDGEHLLLIKTLPEKFDELSAFITANHSYEVPEIVAVDAARVSEQYLKWMEAAISGQ